MATGDGNWYQDLQTYTNGNEFTTYTNSPQNVVWSSNLSGNWEVKYDEFIPAVKKEQTLEDVINDCVRELKQ